LTIFIHEFSTETVSSNRPLENEIYLKSQRLKGDVQWTSTTALPPWQHFTDDTALILNDIEVSDRCYDFKNIFAEKI
jgi:hypothetical protein